MLNLSVLMAVLLLAIGSGAAYAHTSIKISETLPREACLQIAEKISAFAIYDARTAQELETSNIGFRSNVKIYSTWNNNTSSGIDIDCSSGRDGWADSGGKSSLRYNRGCTFKVTKKTELAEMTISLFVRHTAPLKFAEGIKKFFAPTAAGMAAFDSHLYNATAVQRVGGGRTGYVDLELKRDSGECRFILTEQIGG